MGIILNLLCQNFDAIGQIFNGETCQILKLILTSGHTVYDTGSGIAQMNSAFEVYLRPNRYSANFLFKKTKYDMTWKIVFRGKAFGD